MHWKWILILVLLGLLVIFTVQNYEIVKIQFLVWSFETSRAIIIFGTLIVGISIGWITSFLARRD